MLAQIYPVKTLNRTMPFAFLQQDGENGKIKVTTVLFETFEWDPESDVDRETRFHALHYGLPELQELITVLRNTSSP